jgi:hypothetical protein
VGIASIKRVGFDGQDLTADETNETIGDITRKNSAPIPITSNATPTSAEPVSALKTF